MGAAGERAGVYEIVCTYEEEDNYQGSTNLFLLVMYSALNWGRAFMTTTTGTIRNKEYRYKCTLFKLSRHVVVRIGNSNSPLHKAPASERESEIFYASADCSGE